jgi:LysM repeat protein
MEVVRDIVRFGLAIPMPWQAMAMVGAMFGILYGEFCLTTVLRHLAHHSTPGASLLVPLLRVMVVVAILTTANWMILQPFGRPVAQAIEKVGLGPYVQVARQWSGRVPAALWRFVKGGIASTGEGLTPTTGSRTVTSTGTPAGKTITHTVQSGDTLRDIAQHFGVSATAIVEANRAKYPGLVDNPPQLKIGWILEIPAATKQ